MEINHEEIGKRIRERRQRMGFSQEMLANLVGVHHTKISRLESGKLEPRFDLISKISYYLQIRIDDLLEFGPLVSVAFTRSDLRPKIVLEPYELHALALHKKENQLNPFYLVVTQTQRREGSSEIENWDDIKFFQHPGEEFLYVESGIIKVYFAEETGSGFKPIFEHPELFPLTLMPGDSLCFDSDIPHTYVSVLEPEGGAGESFHLDRQDLETLEREKAKRPDVPLGLLAAELRMGRPAHALVVCSSMILKPDDLRQLKERFYSPGSR